jgi:tetratricopeptide (TPR) repeat protein
MRQTRRRASRHAQPEADLFEQTEDLITETVRKRDLEAAIAAFPSMLRRTRRAGDRNAEALCLMALAYRLWEVGRLEAALRCFEGRARLEPSAIQYWISVAALHRALGRPERSLRVAAAIIEVSKGRLSAKEACYRAEMCHEAALSAHLLGRREEAIVWLERATEKLPKSLKLAHETDARLLLQALCLLAGRASPTVARRLADSASAEKSGSLAAAAAAVAAWALGDQDALARWRTEAARAARRVVGHPFCHDGWQQPYALLRAIAEPVASSPPRNEVRGGAVTSTAPPRPRAEEAGR